MKNVIGALLLFVAMAAAGNAMAGQAGDARVGVTLASHHFFDAPNELDGFCEDNLGLEAEYHVTDTVFISAGRYRNSICDRSTFLGLGKELDSGKVFGVQMYTGVEVGIANGYDRLIEVNESTPALGDNALMGGGFFRFSVSQHNIKLRYMVVLVAASYQYEF